MGKKRNTKIKLIVEKQEDHYWGRVEGYIFLPVGQGKTIEAMIQDVKDCIKDYQQHEGKEDAFWGKLNTAAIAFELHYDLQAFFEQFEAIKINSIAKAAGLNESLVRQYASGKKHPSGAQAKKIQDAVHELGSRLQQVSIYT